MNFVQFSVEIYFKILKYTHTLHVNHNVNILFTIILNIPKFLPTRFDIKDAPRFGRLERLRGHGKWASTKRFFSRQLEKGKVRYVHAKGSPSTDSFSFTVTVPVNSGSSSTSMPGGIMAYTEDTFKIEIISNIIRVRIVFFF